MLKSKEEILNWLSEHNQKEATYHIHDNLIVDVDGNFLLENGTLEQFPIQFGKVDGDFDCLFNRLTSLNGCPEIINGNFSCNNNHLTSLKGCPKKINGYFDCSFNNLTSLEYCPQKVNGNFWCSLNKLTSLKDCPKKLMVILIVHLTTCHH